MSYTPFNWLPRLGQGLNKFTDQTTGQVLTLNSTPDSITQEGTPFSAARMNALEQGLGNVYDKSEQMASTIPALFGLGSGAVPSDIFQVLSAAALQRTTSQPKYNEVTIDLSTAQVGDIINLPFNGVMTPHLVLNVGNPNSALYDSSCNGVWMCMVDIYGNAVWSSSNSNYGLSTIHTDYLPNTILPLYSSEIQNSIIQVKIPYGDGHNSQVYSGANGLSTKLFLLSGYEVGGNSQTSSYLVEDGSVLAYFDDTSGTNQSQKRIANYLGTPSSWWTRSPSTYYVATIPYSAYYINSSGGLTSDRIDSSYGIRPAFIMPTTFSTTVYTDDGGNVYDAQEYYTKEGLYDVLGNLLLTLPGVQIETGSYVGTGTYGENNPNSLTFGFEPKLVALLTYKSGASNAINLLGNTSEYLGISFKGVFLVYTETLSSAETVGSGFFMDPTSYNQFPVSYMSADRKTIYWYVDRSGTSPVSNESPRNQCNISGSTYTYIAIG